MERKIWIHINLSPFEGRRDDVKTLTAYRDSMYKHIFQATSQAAKHKLHVMGGKYQIIRRVSYKQPDCHSSKI